MEKCLVALSGGVDSSVALHLLKEKYDCLGGTLVLHDCAPQGQQDAARVAAQGQVPFCSFHCREEFRQQVMGDFIRCYSLGRTPNPCIRCNRHLKFGALLEKAKQLDCAKLATGHYARVSYHQGSGRWLLQRGKDPAKDQSYMLWSLSQEQLSHALFPLGEYSKEEIRAMAREWGIPVAEKKDSQDICFIPDGDYAGFLTRATGLFWQEGDFVDRDGRVLGRHKGIIHYTVGQRRGLGVSAPEPLYVLAIRPEDNTVVLGPNEALFQREAAAKEVNLISVAALPDPIRCTAKLRYHHAPAPALAYLEGDTLRVLFDEPQRAITPGQSLVLYDGDTVIGGGVIR